ncbi:NADPH-dependent FMN reductase [Kribbella flavida DSM 17836]|uniref:NADPH-dependent FMN reductase n=1 Tax=Kribbella flavida (strain DSM 17836 / JCM 10339 / NBRC 14399) TaxID=479435 RepID=D2Q506_KRIFD|nr:NAD(P)H-dependent oxidoreductase [Kribbella flavida]ADB34261.1 NADPH-dependent FMN reductase [Kribbella flavida DSM 17836]
MPSVAFEPRIVANPPVWPQPVVTVVGNPKAGSRTAAAAASVAELLASELGTPYRMDDLVDLVTFAPAIFQGEDAVEAQRAALGDAVDLVSSASVLVVATPVYKGSYTGLLKSFLDVLRPQALAGAVVVPVTVSAAPSHKLLADQHLRPVLAELGASVPVPGVVLEERELEDLQVVLSGWIRQNASIVQATTIALQPVAEPTPAQ